MLHAKLVTTQTSWSFSGARIPVRATSSPVIASVERNSFLARSAVKLRSRLSLSPAGRIPASAHPAAASATVFPGSSRKIFMPLRFRQIQFARSRSMRTYTQFVSRTMWSGTRKRPSGDIGNAIGVSCPSLLFERLEGLDGVHQGRSPPGDGRHVDRLGHLLQGGPRGGCSPGVDIDAVRTLDRVGHREGDQLLGLLAERPLRERGGYPCVVRIVRLRRVVLEIGKCVQVGAGVEGTGHFELPPEKGRIHVSLS